MIKEGYITVKEIIEEISQEEGIPKSQLTDIWKHQKLYTQKLMETEDVFSIFLPFIGHLSLNVKQVKVELKNRSRKVYEKFLNKVKKLEEHDNFTYYGNPHKKVTGVNRLARRIIKRYHTDIVKERKLIPTKLCWRIIENYSNNKYKKKEDD